MLRSLRPRRRVSNSGGFLTCAKLNIRRDSDYYKVSVSTTLLRFPIFGRRGSRGQAPAKAASVVRVHFSKLMAYVLLTISLSPWAGPRRRPRLPPG